MDERQQQQKKVVIDTFLSYFVRVSSTSKDEGRRRHKREKITNKQSKKFVVFTCENFQGLFTHVIYMLFSKS